MLFVYAGKGETEDEKERIHFLTDTFLPFGMRTEIFYAEHFGRDDGIGPYTINMRRTSKVWEKQIWEGDTEEWTGQDNMKKQNWN